MIYLASNYSDPSVNIMTRRFVLVEMLTAQLFRAKVSTYSPIVHTHDISRKYGLPTDASFWKGYNFDALDACTHGVFLQLPGWEASKGLEFEAKYCLENDISMIQLQPKMDIFSSDDAWGEVFRNIAIDIRQQLGAWDAVD